MSDELQHYGVKGMKWGVRRAAKRDAKKSLKAKYSYDKGAGTARKHAKSQVAHNTKKYGEDYTKIYNKFYEKYDTEHTRKSAVRNVKAKKAVRGAKSAAWKITNRQGAIGLAAAGADFVMANPQLRNAVVNAAKSGVTSVQNAGSAARRKRNAAKLNKMMGA